MAERKHILSKHKDEEAPEEIVKQLPNCPVCGAKAFLAAYKPDGYWFGWSVGCPRYRLFDKIHGHDFDTPLEEHLVGHEFDTKEEAAAWWRKRVEMENERKVT